MTLYREPSCEHGLWTEHLSDYNYSDEVGHRSGSALTREGMYEPGQDDFLRVSTGAVNAALHTEKETASTA